MLLYVHRNHSIRTITEGRGGQPGRPPRPCFQFSHGAQLLSSDTMSHFLPSAVHVQLCCFSYVHRDHKDSRITVAGGRDGEPSTSTSIFTQLYVHRNHSLGRSGKLTNKPYGLSVRDGELCGRKQANIVTETNERCTSYC